MICVGVQQLCCCTPTPQKSPSPQCFRGGQHICTYLWFMTTGLESSMMSVPPHITRGARPMSSISHLQTAVETLLTESAVDLPRAARQRLVFFVIGVLLAGTLVVRRVATTHAYIASCTTLAASHERRLRRALNEPAL